MDVRNISKTYTIRKGGLFNDHTAQVRALEDVSLHINRGECLGLVGESGCGKTTLSKINMRARSADSGEILFNDRGKQVALHSMDDHSLIDYRRKIQFVFQDPFSSLNPRMTVLDIISEPLVIHGMGDRDQRVEVVKELMRHVGFNLGFCRDIRIASAAANASELASRAL